MDRSLEDVIAERQRSRYDRGHHRGHVAHDIPRDQIRKWHNANDAQDIETDWVHDKFEDDPHTRQLRGPRQGLKIDDCTPSSTISSTTKIRVDNLHYDLTEDDLVDLFTRIAPVVALSLRFDRAGRSTGTAFVTYSDMSSAHRAIREYDGANAAGQPIRLNLVAIAPPNKPIRRLGAVTPTRNPFDTATRPCRSLFDRIENPDRGSRPRSRSRSPSVARRTNVQKPPPNGVDRYVPSDARNRASRSRSPRHRKPAALEKRGMDAKGKGRDAGDYRSNGNARARDRQRIAHGRPRKTQEDLDREMDDYWGNKDDVNGLHQEPKGDTSIDGEMDVA